jgi:hypothetical protein
LRASMPERTTIAIVAKMTPSRARTKTLRIVVQTAPIGPEMQSGPAAADPAGRPVCATL